MLQEPPDVEQPAEALPDGRQPAVTPAQPDGAALLARSDADQRQARLAGWPLVVPRASAKAASPAGPERARRGAAEPAERPAEVALVVSMVDRLLLPARAAEAAGAESAAPSDVLVRRALWSARLEGPLDAAAPSSAGARRVRPMVLLGRLMRAAAGRQEPPPRAAPEPPQLAQAAQAAQAAQLGSAVPRV
jgi:hypothetical protein